MKNFSNFIGSRLSKLPLCLLHPPPHLGLATMTPVIPTRRTSLSYGRLPHLRHPKPHTPEPTSKSFTTHVPSNRRRSKLPSKRKSSHDNVSAQRTRTQYSMGARGMWPTLPVSPPPQPPPSSCCDSPLKLLIHLCSSPLPFVLYARTSQTSHTFERSVDHTADDVVRLCFMCDSCCCRGHCHWGARVFSYRVPCGWCAAETAHGRARKPRSSNFLLFFSWRGGSGIGGPGRPRGLFRQSRRGRATVFFGGRGPVTDRFFRGEGKRLRIYTW